MMESALPSDSADDKEAICHRMVLVCGTSTCHIAVSRNKLFIPGVWGPYWSAMIPQFWLTEGGQSATGALLDHIIKNHMVSPHIANRAASQDISIYELLNKMLETMGKELISPFLAALTKDIHVLPNFHGNRNLVDDYETTELMHEPRDGVYQWVIKPKTDFCISKLRVMLVRWGDNNGSTLLLL
ncbi:hypothetical protein Droror1_Dr00000014 [Drosera rotundifolia]